MSSTPRERAPSVVKLINSTFTGTTLVPIWTPAVGRRIYFQGCALRPVCVTALVGATVGHGPVIAENVFNPMVSLGVFATATDAAGTNYGFTWMDLENGVPFSAVDAPLYLGTHANATIGAGVIRVCGMVWGDER